MLKEKLMELLKKKKREGSEVSDVEKDAKLSAVKSLRGMASEMMGDGLKGMMDKGMKKVTVASDSAEGLEEGLEKAKDIVESKEGDMESEDESSDEEYSEEKCDTPEEIDAMIARLIEKKKSLSKDEA